jgi:hypothetical protein
MSIIAMAMAMPIQTVGTNRRLDALMELLEDDPDAGWRDAAYRASLARRQ